MLTPFEDFRVKGRGGLGVTCHNLTDKTGLLAGIAAVDDGDDLMMITDQGTIIRTPVKNINTYSRGASGVIVMRLADGQSIVNFAKVAHEDVTENDVEEQGTEQVTEQMTAEPTAQAPVEPTEA